MTGKQAQIDEFRDGGSFISESDLRVHFGLGKALQLDLLGISWPNGRINQFNNAVVNKVLTVREGEML